MRKIGILGGTFDPPHLGHLVIAEQAREACQLDEVWFMPAKIPPHKCYSNLCSDRDRVEMVKRAIENNPFFHLSLVEFERKGPSYTIDTMIELKQHYHEVDFYFIIGGDMINYLPHWKDIEELLNMLTFVGVQRPGHRLTSLFSEKIIMIEGFRLDISSSGIRERLQANKSIRYIVPDAVYHYIKERRIYGNRSGSANN